MKWYLGAALLLLLALVFKLGLLAYAMYVLLALLMSSRVLARIGSSISQLRASAIAFRPRSASRSRWSSR